MRSSLDEDDNDLTNTFAGAYCRWRQSSESLFGAKVVALEISPIGAGGPFMASRGPVRSLQVLASFDLTKVTDADADIYFAALCRDEIESLHTNKVPL